MQTEPVFKGHGWVIGLLGITLLLDGALAQVLGQWVMQPNFVGVPQLTLLTLIMTALLLPDERFIVVIAAGFGLLFDSFYTGLLGINMLLWPLLIYVVRTMAPYVPETPFLIGAVAIISMTVFDVANYCLNRFVGYADVSLVTLIARHLGPGLVVNLALFAVTYLPLRRILVRLRLDER